MSTNIAVNVDLIQVHRFPFSIFRSAALLLSQVQLENDIYTLALGLSSCKEYLYGKNVTAT